MARLVRTGAKCVRGDQYHRGSIWDSKQQNPAAVCASSSQIAPKPFIPSEVGMDSGMHAVQRRKPTSLRSATQMSVSLLCFRVGVYSRFVALSGGGSTCQ